MVDYREILRLASEPRNSQRQIAASVGSSHHTVKEVVETARLNTSFKISSTDSRKLLQVYTFQLPPAFTTNSISLSAQAINSGLCDT